MGRGNCIVCTDIRDIPSDAVPLVSYGGRKVGKGGSWEYENLHRLCKAGELRHWKFTRGRTGQLFVMPDQATQALDALKDRKSRTDGPACSLTDSLASAATHRHVEAAVVALCEINNGITLMQATLERLTAAVESIATQPKLEPAGSWRDMNGESL
jgi:hypothetical protein